MNAIPPNDDIEPLDPNTNTADFKSTSRSFGKGVPAPSVDDEAVKHGWAMFDLPASNCDSSSTIERWFVSPGWSCRHVQHGQGAGRSESGASLAGLLS
jgi:hypothetical protein